MTQEAPTKTSIVESCDLLTALHQDAKAKLALDSTLCQADRGETIWLAGSPADKLAIVGTGFVKMTKNSQQGSEIALEILGPGQCFGLLAAIDGSIFPLNAVAITPTWYLKVPAPALLGLYNTDTNLKDRVVRSMTPRLRKAHDMMSRLSSGTVEERLAAVLFILSDSYGKRTNSEITLAVPLTRQDLSEMAGTTVETTIRVMSKWQKEGILSTHHQVITILKEDLLAEAVR